MKLWNGMTYAEAHKKMWTDLGDNINLSEYRWIENQNKDDESIPCGDCFACEEAINRRGNYRDEICSFCPICENTSTPEQCLNGLFAKWDNAEHLEKAKLAYEIANLEWEEVEGEAEANYPNIGDICFRIVELDIVKCIWGDYKFLQVLWDLGNVFLLEEEAIAEVEYRKINHKLKQFAKKYNDKEFNWQDINQKKWYLVYHISGNKLCSDYEIYNKANNIYFTSEEIAKKAIKEIGEENLIKYYFKTRKDVEKC